VTSTTRALRPDENERLFVRTTVDGVAVRAHRFANRSVGIGLSTETFAWDSGVPFPTETPVVAVLDGNVVGMREASPVSFVVVSASPSVASVRAQFAGGGTDEMHPFGGVAVLARKGNYKGSFVEALDATGQVIGSDALGQPKEKIPTSPPLIQLFSRTTSEGLALHVRTGNVFVPLHCPSDQGTCPDLRNGIQIEMASPEWVWVVRLQSGERTGPASIMERAGAGPNHGSFNLTVVRTSADVGLVRGGGDEMAPVDGYAVLVSLSDPYARVEALDADGKPLTVTDR